jgi:ABC-type protease/lipase transport system fused ATPase/permease subunit
MAMPRGYDTKITEDGLPLARGDRERLALARALMAKPRVLVVDSPSDALIADFAMGQGAPLQEFLAAGNAVVIAARGPVPLPLPQRCYRLSDGRLSEQPAKAQDTLILRSEVSA